MVPNPFARGRYLFVKFVYKFVLTIRVFGWQLENNSTLILFERSEFLIRTLQQQKKVVCLCVCVCVRVCVPF